MKVQRAARQPLTVEDAARIKGMLLRKDFQSDIAQYHSCNQGRIIEIKKGLKFKDVPPMAPERLPPPGPYIVVDRVGHERGQYAQHVVRELREQLRQITGRLEKELDRLEGEPSVEYHSV